MIGPAVLFAAAAVGIAFALQISSGFYDLRALVLVVLAAGAAVAGAVWRRRGGGVENPGLAQALLGAGCAAGLVWTLFGNPTLSGDPRAFRGGFRWIEVTALVVLSAYLCLHLRASLIRARFLILLGCFAVMGLVVIRASPASGPLGDVRYALLALMLGAAWLLARAVPGRSSSGELAALLVLFQPRTLLVLEQAWTEPLVLFCFALAVFCVSRGVHWAMKGAALGLLTAIAIAVLGPFAVGDPVRTPFQADPLSLVTLARRVLGLTAQRLVLAGPLLGAAVLGLCVRRNPGLPLATAALAASWAVVLLWSKQSFCNSWWLCAGLLAAAAAFPAERTNHLATAVPPG